MSRYSTRHTLTESFKTFNPQYNGITPAVMDSECTGMPVPTRISWGAVWVRTMSDLTQDYRELISSMSEYEEEIHNELAMRILKSNARLLLWTNRITADTNRNFEELIRELGRQIKGLEKKRADDTGVTESLRSHIKAHGMLEQYHREGLTFTQDIIRRMVKPSKSFSLEESSEEKSTREMKFRASLNAVTAELEKVTSSAFVSLKDKKAALKKATMTRDDILMKNALGDQLAARTMKREGLSKDLWGESLDERLDRQMIARKGEK